MSLATKRGLSTAYIRIYPSLPEARHPWYEKASTTIWRTTTRRLLSQAYTMASVSVFGHEHVDEDETMGGEVQDI